MLKVVANIFIPFILVVWGSAALLAHMREIAALQGRVRVLENDLTGVRALVVELANPPGSTTIRLPMGTVTAVPPLSDDLPPTSLGFRRVYTPDGGTLKCTDENVGVLWPDPNEGPYTCAVDALWHDLRPVDGGP